MEHTGRASIGRDVLVATAAVMGLYALGQASVPPFQIPGYLLIVGFDALEGVFGSAGGSYQVLFVTYLLGVGVAGGTVAHYARRWADVGKLPSWRVGLAGALAAVGAVSLAFGSVVLVGTSQLGPVLVTAGAGVVLLGLAAGLLWLGDLRERRR